MKQETYIARSDKRIREAIETLSAHHRGLTALADFRKLAKGPAQGLDSQGMVALKVLVQEWSIGRRDFLDTLPQPLPTVSPCVYCGEVDCTNPTDCPQRRQNNEEDARLGL